MPFENYLIQWNAFFPLQGTLEFFGLILGLLAVVLLVRQHIATWPAGIGYVLISLYLFWTERLYADLGLHVIFLFLNIYGWYAWRNPPVDTRKTLPVTRATKGQIIRIILLSVLGTVALGYVLMIYTDADMPFPDSATSVFSIAAMWMTARKKIQNWHLWFFIDVLAAGIYFYKGLYFYALLYFIYLGLAVMGYMAWKKTLEKV